AGFDASSMPPWSVGFVYLPAAIGISVTSLLLAPVGAKLAHRLKGPTLRRIFAVFLLVVAAKVAISV
ncbi:MAG TPA: TSUP family transporter, partial [Usitatibacter sp.]|nr:TSUP family transporter [Usitatibacter sp.]